MKTIISFSLITVTILATALSADAQKLTRDEMDRLSETYLKESIHELRDMLAVPNIGSIPEHVNANIEWMDEAFTRRGFTNTLLETAGPPLLLAEKNIDSSLPTVNNDNNQHSPDENLRIGNLQEGIKTVLSILSEPVH